ncbi:cupin domain-containing protein [Paraglaciecola aquimarina]|uniref:Cupin domain-containing protein n=1 Tax=Paraglaciecola aquimarina TaxID=1235557 RepID=A0ABU3SZQ1_9ALTE|nr:cupin domain-containing protein [Paraglaciecola aquimarina]MDU0355495.1 cupin domain-containing protein [Paraglaciecola aquimarina]
MKKTDFEALLGSVSLEQEQPSPTLTGQELDDLLGPVSRQEFVSQYFSKTSLHLKGAPDKFSAIFSWERLKHALERGKCITDKLYNIKASYAAGEDSGDPHDAAEVSHDKVIDVLNGGGTICISNIQMADPFLAEWALAISGQLNFTGTVGINCYISQDGSGFPMHYDARVATTIQVAGKKLWKYSTEAAIPWPTNNAVYQAGNMTTAVGKLPDNMDIQEVVLEPGDVLCLPAGAWHSARGIGCSMALNLSFTPQNYLAHLLPLLEKFAEQNPYWRGGPPATADKIQGNVPAEVVGYFRHRMAELQQLAEHIVRNENAPVEPWLRSLTRASYKGKTQIRAIPEVSPKQLFAVSAPPLRYIEFQGLLLISFNNEIHKFPTSLAPTLQRMADNSTAFTIPEILALQHEANGLPHNEVIHYMQVLYKFGIIDLL